MKAENLHRHLKLPQSQFPFALWYWSIKFSYIAKGALYKEDALKHLALKNMSICVVISMQLLEDVC